MLHGVGLPRVAWFCVALLWSLLRCVLSCVVVRVVCDWCVCDVVLCLSVLLFVCLCVCLLVWWFVRLFVCLVDFCFL